MRQILIVLLLTAAAPAIQAQTNFALYNPTGGIGGGGLTTNSVFTSDDGFGDVGIGISTLTSGQLPAALMICNQMYSSSATNPYLSTSGYNQPNALLLLANLTNTPGNASASGNTQYTLGVVRIDPTATYQNPDLVVDNTGLVGIGNYPALGNPTFGLAGNGITNAHLFITDANTDGYPLLAIYTHAGIDAMTVTGTGAVGIGTTEPLSLLDVYGGVAIGGYAGIAVAPSNGMIVSGAVGIGTPTPAYPLDVSGSAGISGGILVGGSAIIGGSSTINGTSYTNGTATFVGDVTVGGIMQLSNGAANGYILQSDASGNASWVSQSSVGAGLWTLASNGTDIYNSNTGNIGIGTNTPQANLQVQGTVMIGSFNSSVLPMGASPAPNPLTAGGYSLYVQYGILTERVKVALTDGGNWSDYVFDKDYKLPDLDKVKEYIALNHHLPDVPSAGDVSCDGIDLGSMDATLLKKIEELTLYVLELKKENEDIKNQMAKK